MKRLGVACVIAFAGMLLLVASVQSASAQDAQGAVLWGSSWAWRTITGSGSLPALVTYHKDGEITGSDLAMFGGTTNNPYRYTPFSGTWERIGPNEFAGTSLFLRFDPATNKLVGIARARSQFTFAGDFNHIAGVMRLDVLPCPTPATCPDPLANDANWQAYNQAPLPNEFAFVAARIAVVRATE